MYYCIANVSQIVKKYFQVLNLPKQNPQQGT